MEEQDTQIPTGPIELDPFADETKDKTATEPVTASASAEADETLRKKKKKKKQKKQKLHNADGQSKPKTMLEQLHEFINEDEDQPININIHGLLGGDGLPSFFKRNWLFISIIVFFTCCYVTCRYMMQSAVLEYDKLTEQLVDRRYKNLTLDCDLLEHTLSSRVEKSLKDSTIHQPVDQSYSLKATE